MTRITGIERSVIDKLLRSQQTALVQTTDDDRQSDRQTGSRVEGAAPDGYVARDNTYVIQPNDTLFEICQRFYGGGTKWRELARINSDKIGDDGAIYP